MKAQKRILLRFSSNIEAYEVAVYDCNQVYRKRIYGREDCLRLCTSSPYLRVVASPLTSGYSTKLYFWIDVCRPSVLDLYFSFPAPIMPAPSVSLNLFTLTDSTYGLPIDGSLLFTQT